MLKIDRVTKVYRVGTFGRKKLHAVDNVSFTVNEGEVVSLIGESGSGKTTIGKMILHLIPITSGLIIFKDFDISNLKGSALRNYWQEVQGVFQDPFSSFNPIFKVDRTFGVIRREFFRKVNRHNWRDRVAVSLRAVGLDPDQVWNKFPHQLSGGQLQRLLIARALLQDVRFLVADEITSMIDASTRVEILNLLAELKHRGLSVLFITHDLSLGYYISDRTVILYKGRIVEKGLSDGIYFDPIHPYTRMLMDSLPRLDKKWGKAEIGLKAKQAKLADGCVYYERCPVLDKDWKCRDIRPDLREVEPNHFVACHYPMLQKR
ncbi:MAG: oligopeptide ABC transporter ATP-binding protein [Desulfobacteraceae bacterium 4484_190.1]|nr:MAG: oligopeptide ABC transporter ATP-binding protein [Desulfobacteraceae bacterium 4484_190.1]